MNRAMPIEPPICWTMLTVAEATPTSARSTPVVAVAIAAVKTVPMPKPTRISAGKSTAV